MQAVKDNKFVSPLSDPGNADITSHIDFNDITIQAKNEMVDDVPDTQGTFLKKMGAVERLKSLENLSDSKTKKELHLGLNRLINPKEMGELFKVFAITPNKYPSPEGFTCGTRSS